MQSNKKENNSLILLHCFRCFAKQKQEHPFKRHPSLLLCTVAMCAVCCCCCHSINKRVYRKEQQKKNKKKEAVLAAATATQRTTKRSCFAKHTRITHAQTALTAHSKQAYKAKQTKKSTNSSLPLSAHCKTPRDSNHCTHCNSEKRTFSKVR